MNIDCHVGNEIIRLFVQDTKDSYMSTKKDVNVSNTKASLLLE